MENRFFQRKQSKLDDPIDKILKDMDEFAVDTTEFKNAVDQLERLRKLQDTETWQKRLDPNTVALALGNLGVVAIIVAYEQKHVLVSKAMALLQRNKNSQM